MRVPLIMRLIVPQVWGARVSQVEGCPGGSWVAVTAQAQPTPKGLGCACITGSRIPRRVLGGRDCTCTAHPEGSGVYVYHGQPDAPEGLGWP